MCEGEGTQGATRCCRLSRQLLLRYGCTVACVGLFVSFVALLDKPVEDTSTRYQVPGMDWRVDATVGGLNIQRADEILNSVSGSSCLANSSDL